MLAHARALSHRRDHRLAKVLRVGAREAHALDPLDRIAGPEQLAEFRVERRSEITAPRVDVLPEEGDLSDAFTRELLNLGHDLARPPTLLATANRRDDAIRADGVAPHRYLYPGLMSALAMVRQGTCKVLVCPEAPARHSHTACADPLAEVRDRPGAERHVDERVAGEDRVALRLGKASAHRNDRVGPPALARGCVPQVGRQLRVGLFADRARVEHEHVSLLRVVDLTEPE